MEETLQPAAPIYLIGYVSYDDHNWRSVTLDEDFGYFTTREEAQAEVDRLHGFGASYAEYLAREEEDHNVALQAYNQRKIDRQRALDAGLGDLVPEPRVPVKRPVKTFEQYTYDRGTLYAVMEVAHA